MAPLSNFLFRFRATRLLRNKVTPVSPKRGLGSGSLAFKTSLTVHYRRGVKVGQVPYNPLELLGSSRLRHWSLLGAVYGESEELISTSVYKRRFLIQLLKTRLLKRGGRFEVTPW